ncbi:hypothetical protein ACP275_06G037100 [Erythranthe tilingii]
MSGIMKSVLPVVMLILVVADQTQVITKTEAQSSTNCAATLGNLNVCAPFLVPGGATPGTDCCTALSTVDRDCLCSTLRIASRIPVQCNLPPLTCSAN